MVCFTPLLFLPVYLCANVGPRGLLAAAWPAPCVPQSATLLGPPAPRLVASPLCPGCLSPPLLPVWVSVSSLSPWLSDFCTDQFSVTSGCFLFLNCSSFGCARRCSVSTYASILARSIFGDFLGRHIYHLRVETVSLLFYQSEYLSFLFLIALAITFSTLLNKCEKNEHICRNSTLLSIRFHCKILWDCSYL